MPLELLDRMFSEVYDALNPRVLWHLHEAHNCFCHRGDGSSEDWVRGIVEFMVEIARGKANALDSSGPAFSFALVSCPASCASSFILILRSVLVRLPSEI